MKRAIRTVVALLGVATVLSAQPAPSLEVTLESERTVMLPYQLLPVTLTVRNTGGAPLGPFAREDVLPRPCFVAAHSAGPGQPREGHWLTRAEPAELPGMVGPLLPGEAWSIALRLKLPRAFEAGGKLVAIQWAGRRGIFEGRRSAGELTLNLRKNEGKPVVNFLSDEGAFTIELWPDAAPQHVANFLKLAREGFYDGLVFHRVVPGSIVQTGCRDGTGTSDPGFTLGAEFNDRNFLKGTVGMARRGNDENSASTQWFITLRDLPDLNGKYTAFGRVVDGLLVPDAIGRVPVEGDRPVRAPRIREVEVELPPGYEIAEPRRIETTSSDEKG